MATEQGSPSKLFDLQRLKKEGLKAGELLAVDSEIYQKLMIHSDKNIKRDKMARNMVLLTGISAYTKDPINLFLKGNSGIGKTHNVTKMLAYFPKQDVWMLGGLSPKALIHDYGVLLDENDNEIDWDDKPGKDATKEEKHAWRDRLQHSRMVIDLQGKILAFLEAPYIETYYILRPILSHDKWEISYRFTDKTASGRLRTTHVVIRGWPATIFCSTQEKYVQDLATRGFTITPETEQGKYREANILTGEHKALPWKFREDFDFKLLQGYIAWLSSKLQDINVVIPYGRELGGALPSQYARSMRDFNHLTALIEVLAAFHCMQRPVLVREYNLVSLKEGRETENEYSILATRADYEHIMGLWEEVEETTVTGLPGHILNFFHKAVEPLSEDSYGVSFNYEDLTQKYNETATEKKSSDTIRKWVKHLCDVGWTTKEPDPNDKRKIVVKVIKTPKDSGESRIPLFQDFFSAEAFRKWFDDAKKISEHNHFVLKENMLTEETSVNAICEKYFCSDIFESHSKLESPSKSATQPEDSGIQQSPIIPSRTASYSEVATLGKDKSIETLNDEQKPSSIPLEQKTKPLDDEAIDKAFPKMTIEETIILLRSKWTKGTSIEFVDLIHQVRPDFTRKEASTLLADLIEEGKMTYDSDGLLTWRS